MNTATATLTALTATEARAELARRDANRAAKKAGKSIRREAASELAFTASKLELVAIVAEAEAAPKFHADPITAGHRLGYTDPNATCYCPTFQQKHDAVCDCGFTVHHESECGGCANGEFCCGTYA